MYLFIFLTYDCFRFLFVSEEEIPVAGFVPVPGQPAHPQSQDMRGLTDNLHTKEAALAINES